MNDVKRNSLRKYDELRQVKITRSYTKYAAGSVLIEFGETKVLCTASIDENLPAFLKDKKAGWVTAEYSMLPSSTHTRNRRDSVTGKVNARAQEISRLIGRSLRAGINLNMLGERQILIDCDVIQADGGTRVASITGAFVALHDAINQLLTQKKITTNPISKFVAAVSVGVVNDSLVLDLDYGEDSNCDSDLNIVMFEGGDIIEIQGTAEKQPFSQDTLNDLLKLADRGITQLIQLQKQSLSI